MLKDLEWIPYGSNVGFLLSGEIVPKGVISLRLSEEVKRKRGLGVRGRGYRPWREINRCV